MAKRKFTLDEARTPKILLERGWPWKPNVREVIEFSLAIKPWLNTLQDIHGKLLNLEHFDQPDDPPDVMAQFENSEIGFEVTLMLPKEIGKFNSVIHKATKGKIGTISPTLSNTPFSKKSEMISYAFSSFRGWADVKEENRLWVQAAGDMFMEKVIRSRSSKIDYVIMTVDELFPDATNVVATALDSFIAQQTEPFPALIIHNQPNALSFNAWLIRKGYDMQHQHMRPKIDPSLFHLSFEEMAARLLDSETPPTETF